MRLTVRAVRVGFGGDSVSHNTPIVKKDTLRRGWGASASIGNARGVTGSVVDVPAIIFVGDAGVTGVLRIAFSLALVARYACLPCPLALVACRGHGLEARAVLGSGGWI